MAFSASIPTALVEAANATLKALGFGPDNFSVQEQIVGNGPVTHAGLSHKGRDPAFRSALAKIPGCILNNTDYVSHISMQNRIRKLVVEG